MLRDMNASIIHIPLEKQGTHGGHKHLPDIDMRLGLLIREACLLRCEFSLLYRDICVLCFNSQRGSDLDKSINAGTKGRGGRKTNREIAVHIVQLRLDILQRTLVAVEMHDTGDGARERNFLHRAAEFVEKPASHGTKCR